MFDANHKTVFVLDHTQYFGISSENLIDLDFVKHKTPGGPPLLPISKSLWTCAVEASAEYCRIVWDLFPAGKLIRFIVSDTAAHIVNTWGPATQNLMHVLNAMSMVGIPPRSTPQSTDFSVIHGLRAAIEAISEPTEVQKEALLLSNPESMPAQFCNKGRVICITSARDNASMKSLEDIFLTVLMQQNAQATSHKDLLAINHCHLVIINLIPANIESLVSNRDVQSISVTLTSEIHSVYAGDISNKLTHLILPHYNLASTTVTGIPMKEEQNASSSANYDVEIFHEKHAHTAIFDSQMILPTSIKDKAEYETVTLKWCTPRSCGASDLQPCLAQHRVTPVDVTSRPSSCLINFLLNGRSVLLEMPRKSGGKLTSHLLSAHGGEIFIHTLHISRSILEDPPSISEGTGGRVIDYRVTDFGTFMKSHKLVPLKPIPERSHDENLKRIRTRLQRRTRYWPLTFGTTIVYNIKQFVDPLLNVINKDDLSDSEVLQCQQVIYSLLGLASKHEPLSLPNMGHRIKGPKKEEQYRLLWQELELLIQSSGSSPQHRTILQCLKDCRFRSSDAGEKGEIDQSATELEKLTEAAHRASVIRATTDSPMSPPHTMDQPFLKNKKISSSGTRSLLDIIMSSEKAQKQKRIEFSGRLCTPPGQIAKLYPNLETKNNSTTREPECKQ